MTANQASLDGMAIFVQVVESGGFSAAARELGNSTSYISKQISRLEDRLGGRLLNRTTRKISLTDEGRLYFERCKSIVQDAIDAERSIHLLSEVPKGLLRVNASVSFGLRFLTTALPEFLERHPKIQLEIELNERKVDMVAEGFDVIIRVGDLADSSLISRQIMSSRGAIVASPDYIKDHGEPTHPSELAHHACICYANTHTPNYWEFTGPDGKNIGIKITPKVFCNSAELEESFAKSGTGITRLPYYVCEKSIKDGSLVEILDGYAKSSLGVYAIYPHRLHLSAKIRTFIDFLAERFST